MSDPYLPPGVSQRDLEGPETVTMRVLLSRVVEVEVAKGDYGMMIDSAVELARDETCCRKEDGWAAEIL